MDPIELGKKIKEARLAKKMTQSEVVGDFITRNMLSQIESGTATPSVKTLEYLAKTLGLNLTSLMPTEETSADDTVRRLESTKKLIREGFWREAADLAEESLAMGLMNDEFSALLARAYYELAKEYDNCAVAPVYSMFESMLSAKEPCDYTSNLYNHPNDFGVRLYAEVVKSVLTGEGSGEEEENNNGGGGSDVTDNGSLTDNPLDINNDELSWKDNGLSSGDSNSLLDSLLKAGDPINLLLGLGVLLVSGGAVLVTVIYRRRKSKSE